MKTLKNFNLITFVSIYISNCKRTMKNVIILSRLQYIEYNKKNNYVQFYNENKYRIIVYLIYKRSFNVDFYFDFMQLQIAMILLSFYFSSVSDKPEIVKEKKMIPIQYSSNSLISFFNHGTRNLWFTIYIMFNVRYYINFLQQIKFSRCFPLTKCTV